MSDPGFGDIDLVVFDVDGVFTDGTFLMDEDGRESKRFHTQDGYGVRRLLDAGVQVAVITGRQSGAVAKRMQELGVETVLQGARDKGTALKRVLDALGVAAERCAYVGDDEPDLAAMHLVALPVAVANAVTRVRDSARYVTAARGGDGAVREVCELIAAARPAR